MAGPGDDGLPFIGSLMSLISSTDIRYEGALSASGPGLRGVFEAGDRRQVQSRLAAGAITALPCYIASRHGTEPAPQKPGGWGRVRPSALSRCFACLWRARASTAPSIAGRWGAALPA